MARISVWVPEQYEITSLNFMWVQLIPKVCLKMESQLLLFYFLTCLSLRERKKKEKNIWVNTSKVERQLLLFSGSLLLSKICIRAVFPKLYGICSCHFTGKFILSNWCARNKKDNFAVLNSELSALPKNCFYAITIKPYGVYSWILTKNKF